MRLLSLRGAWIRPAGTRVARHTAALKRPLRGVFAYFYYMPGLEGSRSLVLPIFPVAAVDGHLVDRRAVAPARRIHAAVYGLYGRCGGAGVKFRAVALSHFQRELVGKFSRLLKPI